MQNTVFENGRIYDDTDEELEIIASRKRGRNGDTVEQGLVI